MKPHIQAFTIGRKRQQWQCRVVGEEDVAVAKSPLLAYQAWQRCVCPHDTVETIGSCAERCCDELQCLDCGKVWQEAK